MDYLVFLVLVYALPTWLVYSLIGWLIRRLSPPPPPEIEAKMRQARKKIEEALENVQRHDRGEDPGYWGDSDIDRLDMALAEASEIRYQSPLREYMPTEMQLVISICLAIGLTNLAMAFFDQRNPFESVDLEFWLNIGVPLGIGIVSLSIVLTVGLVSSRRKKS